LEGLKSSIIADKWFKAFPGMAWRVDKDASSSEVSKERLSNVVVEKADRISGLGEGCARSAGDKRSVSGCR
jgi:hypothetical protein